MLQQYPLRSFLLALFILLGTAPQAIAQPINNYPATHLPLFAPAGTFAEYAGTNVGASGSITPSCGFNASNGVWYALTAYIGQGAYTFSTVGSNFDTVLSVWRYANGSLTEVACNDDIGGGVLQSRIETSIGLGLEMYLVQVSGYNGAEGQIAFRMENQLTTFNPHSVLKQPADAPTLLAGRSHPSSNLNLLANTTNPVSCNTGGGGTNAVWRTFAPSTNGYINIDTEGSTFDTVLSIHNVNGSNELACDDDGGSGTLSRIANFPVFAGQVYFVRVSGYRNTNEGQISLNVSDIFPVSNEETSGTGRVALTSVYPNPFADATTLAYVIPTAQAVRLTVWDVLGREVAVLAAGVQTAGEHEAIFEASTLPSGVYIVRLTVGNTSLTRRVTIVR